MIIKKFNDFKLFENMDRAKKIFNKKVEDFEKLKEMLSKNIGYMGKFTEYLFNENIPIAELQTTYDNLLKLKQRNKQLDINDLTYEELLDKIQDTENNIRITSFINKFPGTQKRLIKDGLKDPLQSNKVRSAILKIVNKENIESFISKISRYKTLDGLLKAIKIFSKDPKNDKPEVLKKIENSKSSIIYDENNILIIHTPTWGEVKEFGCDTSWCIVSSEYQFRNYTKNGGKQFILYNYNLPDIDPKFKIGFTITNGDIRAAHDILDSGSTKELMDIFRENNIEINEYTSKVLKKELGEIKLSSSLSATKWEEVIPSLSKEESIKWVKKVLNYKKTHNFRNSVIPALITNIFKEKNYFLKKDILSIDKSLLGYVTYLNKYVNEDDISGFSIDKLMHPLYDEKIEDQVIANTINFNIIDVLKNTTFLTLNDERSSFLDFLYKKLINIYTDPNIKYEKVKSTAMYKKGLKLTKSFEIILLVLHEWKGGKNNIGGINFTEFKKKLLEDEYCRRIIGDYFSKIVKIEIDLDIHSIYSLEIDQVKNIIKKDYDINFSLGYLWGGTKFKRELGKQNALLNHLKDNKLNITIGKNSFNLYRRYLKQEVEKIIDNQDFIDCLKQAINSRIRKGKEFQKGNITLRII
jgi:hypothetical protein